MKKLFLIILLSLLSNLSFAEDFIISEDLTKVKIKDLTPLTNAQIKEEITNAELYGFFADGKEFQEKHWDDGRFVYSEKKGRLFGTWKVGKNKICYKGEDEKDFDCVDIYKKINNYKTYYYFFTPESGIYARVTKFDRLIVPNNEYVNPGCLTYPLASRDYYQSFYEHYYNVESVKVTDPKFNSFVNNIGNYIGDTVPIADTLNLFPSLGIKKALTNFVKECSGKTKKTFGKVDNKVRGDWKWDRIYVKYTVLMKLPKSLCKTLAPNLKYSCREVSLLEIDNESRIYPVDQFSIFGLFNVGGKTLVVPLRNLGPGSEKLYPKTVIDIVQKAMKTNNWDF